MSDTPQLRYRQPAAEWTDALPLGNGRLGAMVYAGIRQEKISLNEDTFWCGYPRQSPVANGPENFREAQALALAGDLSAAQALVERTLEGPYTESYLPVGDLLIDLEGLPGGEAASYARRLDLDTAVAACDMTLGGIRYAREAFVSAPDQVLVLAFTADRPGCVSLRVRMESLVRHEFLAEDGCLVMRLRAPGHGAPNYLKLPAEESILYGATPQTMGMRAQVAVRADIRGGAQALEGDALVIRGADRVVLRVSIRTSFAGHDRHPETEGRDERRLCLEDLRGTDGASLDALRDRHITDHRALFRRAGFALDLPREDLPTDARLARFQQAQDDPALYELLFHYGRYLLIASSRPGSEAMNLQGIWNDKLRPPWSSNYTVNINTEMNYWPVEVAGLAPLHAPLFDLIDRLRITGAETARRYYGASGAVCHHNTDLWALSGPVGECRPGTAGYAFWNLSYAWLCRHLYDHYLFSGDKAFLAQRALPAIADAAHFFLDILVPDPDGCLVVTPATSPENAFCLGGERLSVSRSATMGDAVVREILETYLACGEALGKAPPRAAEARDALGRLKPFAIGSKGQLLEWDTAYEEVDPHHRHVSHLYGLYPAHLITDGPLAAACRQSLLLRGDGGTGWSLGWKVCLWARLGDGDHALALIKNQLNLVEGNDAVGMRGGAYRNLFGAHPPFQIDGNFGVLAGICEMLVQSVPGRIDLLPALPEAWPDGRVFGLRTRCQAAVDIAFAGGKLAHARIAADADSTFAVSYRGASIPLSLRAGESIALTADDFAGHAGR